MHLKIVIKTDLLNLHIIEHVLEGFFDGEQILLPLTQADTHKFREVINHFSNIVNTANDC
ncbi:hypothetical protein D3C73_1604540 [compost metagenome]